MSNCSLYVVYFNFLCLSTVTFEDKKRENFERGNLELEKRRQALQEQQRKEQERLAALEREEQERKVNLHNFATLCAFELVMVYGSCIRLESICIYNSHSTFTVTATVCCVFFNLSVSRLHSWWVLRLRGNWNIFGWPITNDRVVFFCINSFCMFLFQERERLEQERRRQHELEKQLEKQRELERQREEERRKEIERREVWRTESDNLLSAF